MGPDKCRRLGASDGLKIELLQVEGGADAVGDECRAEAGGHGVLSPPSGAVCRDEHGGVQGGEVVEHAWDEHHCGE